MCDLLKEQFKYARFKRTNLKLLAVSLSCAMQVSTQCNDDALDIDIQTDSPEVIEKWTQHPQDGPLACGGEDSNNFVSYKKV